MKVAVLALGATLLAVPSASSSDFPSCRSWRNVAPGGVVSVQTSPSGTLAWGITIYPQYGGGIGKWNLSYIISGKAHRVRDKGYAPHHSVPAKDARPGRLFTVRGVHYSADGRWKIIINGSTACRIPKS